MLRTKWFKQRTGWPRSNCRSPSSIQRYFSSRPKLKS